MASSTRSSHRFRCSAGAQGCNRYFRVSLKKLKTAPEVKCPHCGCDKVYDVEKWRRKNMDEQTKCNCAPIPFRHRRGSVRMCVHHKLHGVEPTEAELEQYQQMIDTPRTGFM